MCFRTFRQEFVVLTKTKTESTFGIFLNLAKSLQELAESFYL